MKVHDEALWQQQCAELETTEEGRDFRKFLVAWVDEAESLIADGLDTQMCNGLPGNPVTPADALRRALPIVEGKQTRVAIYFLGQMLCVIMMNWEHAEKLAEDLTEIELRLVEDVLSMKIDDLNSQAQEQDVDVE
jgi:hypothetical protein